MVIRARILKFLQFNTKYIILEFSYNYELKYLGIILQKVRSTYFKLNLFKFAIVQFFYHS